MNQQLTHCLVCDKPIKAWGLCSKHHQRFLRSGSVYLKNEKHNTEMNIDLMLQQKKNAPKEKLSLSKYI